MPNTVGRQLASKWLKTSALLRNSYVARHIPQTRLYNPQSLGVMLLRHGTVVLKPVRGSGGHGLMKVSRTVRGFVLKSGVRTKVSGSFGGLVRAVDAARKGRAYLVQKGIHLATVRGRPIDYRVKTVKTAGGWHIRAMVGRIARPGLFVTNLCRGGTQVTAARGIGMSLSPRLITRKKAEMRRLARVSTGLLEGRFPGIGQLGYDFGIDRRGHIWMLEVNTRPQ